jgi:hypothetical protein
VKSLAELKHQSPNSAKMQMAEEGPIFALETTQLKEEQKNFDQEKRFKERQATYIEKTFDNTFLKAISIGEAACKINISIYILMMGFGASLILDAIIVSTFSGVGLFSSVLALLGVASLASILIISPQSKITKNAAKNLQYQILYNGYVNQLEVLKNPDICEIEKSVGDIERISIRLEQLTFNTVDKIENLNGMKTSSK